MIKQWQLLKISLNLMLWNRAMDLAVQIFEITKQFPSEERFGIISQLRRAAVSVAANIAEGFGRFTYPDKMHKYVQARGELVEVMTELHYSQRVGHLSIEQNIQLQQNCENVHKMLNVLITKMNCMVTSSRSPRSEVRTP